MKIDIFHILFVLIILTNCEKNPDPAELVEGQNMLTKIIQFRNLEELTELERNRAGDIGITDIKAFGEQAVSASEIKAHFYNDQPAIITHGPLVVGPINILPNQVNVYRTTKNEREEVQALFGRQINIQLKGISGIEILSSTIVMPAAIFVGSPVGNQLKDIISRNQLILWNSDPTNADGVYIFIDFIPERVNNENFSTASAYRRVIKVNDSGSFQLNPNHFGTIPAGAYIRIGAARGLYVVEKTSGNEDAYLIYIYTAAFQDFFIE
jgi:hypothetical protein